MAPTEAAVTAFQKTIHEPSQHQDDEERNFTAFDYLDSFRISMIEEFDLPVHKSSSASVLSYSSSDADMLRSGDESREGRLLHPSSSTASFMTQDADALSVSSSLPENNIERLEVVVLCFVALPSAEISEECFAPSPHVTFMKLQRTPLFETECATFFLLQFRCQLWIGVSSSSATRTDRCRDVLHWVRHRKMFLPAVASVNDSSAVAAADRKETNARSSRIRHCTALMAPVSGEVYGISPIHLPCDERVASPDINQDLISEASKKFSECITTGRAHHNSIHSAISDWMTILKLSASSSSSSSDLVADVSTNC